jgi:transposase
LFKHLHIYIMSVEHTPSKRGRVLQLRDLNYSYRGIEEITGVSRSTAQETVNRDKNHHTRQSRPRSGRPASVNDRDRRHILRQIRQHRFEPYRSIAEHVGSITERQVKTIAHNAGFHRRVAVRKPFLTKAAVKKRNIWAEENSSRDWDTIIWTDESTIEFGERPGHQMVTRLPGEEYLPECIQPTFHSGRKSMMVWGAIAHGRKGPLIRLNLSTEEIDEVENPKKKKSRGMDGSNMFCKCCKGLSENL